MKKIVIGSAIALMMAAPLASAKTFTLTIVNKTSSVLEAFYASPTNENDWEEDLLGDDAIRPNGRYVVRFRDDRGVCNYDLRFEYPGYASRDPGRHSESLQNQRVRDHRMIQ